MIFRSSPFGRVLELCTGIVTYLPSSDTIRMWEPLLRRMINPCFFKIRTSSFPVRIGSLGMFPYFQLAKTDKRIGFFRCVVFETQFDGFPNMVHRLINTRTIGSAPFKHGTTDNIKSVFIHFDQYGKSFRWAHSQCSTLSLSLESSIHQIPNSSKHFLESRQMFPTKAKGGRSFILPLNSSSVLTRARREKERNQVWLKYESCIVFAIPCLQCLIISTTFFDEPKVDFMGWQTMPCPGHTARFIHPNWIGICRGINIMNYID